MTEQKNSPDVENLPEDSAAATEQDSSALADSSTESGVDSGADTPLQDEAQTLPSVSSEESADEEEEKPRRRFSFLRFLWNLLLFLLLLFAVAGAVGSAWLWWERYENRHPGANTQDEIAIAVLPVKDEIEQLKAGTASLARKENELEDALGTVRASIRTSEQRMRAELAAVLEQTPPTEREWRLAEVEYLLRVANNRALMEQDARGTRQILESADELLAELDDYSLFDVRAKIAEEKAALAERPGLDMEGTFLRLEALKKRITYIPLQTSQFAWDDGTEPEAADDAQETATLSEQLSERLSTIFRFRSDVAKPVRPLLSPEESWYLQQNLHLMLERAQLAMMRKNTVLFTESLDSASGWVSQYYDMEDPSVLSFSEELQALARIELAHSLPDVSGSLNVLRELRASEAQAGGESQ